MADIELVIKIPEELYTEYVVLQLSRNCGKGIVSNLLKAIKNGTPIPKPHGRIIDESKIHEVYTYTEEVICKNIKAINTIITHTDAPTIVEGSDEE